MIKYFLSSNRLVTAPTWVAKQAEMTEGFSSPDGNPMALGCLKQTLVTGDFHQLCVLPLKICNNTAFNSLSFFLMNVRHACTDWWGGFGRVGEVFCLFQTGAFLKNKYICTALPVIKNVLYWTTTKSFFARFLSFELRAGPLSAGSISSRCPSFPLPSDNPAPQAPNCSNSSFLTPPRAAQSQSRLCSPAPPGLTTGDRAEGEISPPKADTLISPVAHTTVNNKQNTQDAGKIPCILYWIKLHLLSSITPLKEDL